MTSVMTSLRALLLIAATAPAPGIAEAQAVSDTLALMDALEMARAANPALRAVRLKADAAAELILPAGALPDPQLMFGFMNRPVDFDTDQAMTMNTVQITQRFPWPGKLGFARQRMRWLAEAEQWDAKETEAVLLARVKSVYFQIAYIDRALRIMGETRDLLRDFFQVSSAMYRVGSGLQQDVLQAQVAIASMTEDITVVQQNRVAMVARLNALLGRGPAVSVNALELPAPTGSPPGQDSLMTLAAESRPALQAVRERVAAAQAGYRAARRALYPDFTITLGYGQRPQFENLVTLMVGISIPLWAGSRQLPLRREMAIMQTMQEARELDLYNETYARIAELTAEADRARNLSVLYATAVLPQARAAVESALSAYRVGEVDYMTLVQNEMTVNRYEIESVRLTAEYHRAIAQIEALIGGQIGEVQ